MADRAKGDGRDGRDAASAAPRPRESAPRAVAARVLARVWGSDAFASAALDAELRRAQALDPRDAGLATELVYGVLRAQAALEARIAEFAAKGRWTTDPLVRAHVLMGAYSLCFLDRVPAFAAVSEAVDGAQAAGGPRVGAFANAVLRKLAAAVESSGRPPLAGAVVASAPGWLRGALRRSLGRAAAEAFLSAGPVPPPTGLCLAPGEDRDAWLEALRGAAPAGSFEAGRVSPRAIVARGAGDLRRLPGFGVAWIGQEEGAQALALALGALPGERVLDACAGRGNKSWLLSRAVLPGGAVDAADLYPAKLSQLREALSAPPASSESAGAEAGEALAGGARGDALSGEALAGGARGGDALAGEAPAGGALTGAGGGLARAAAFVRETYAVDWTVGAGDVPEGYDRVLVDAPCSGVGTLRRRPEIALRREADDLPRLADLQVAIARRAATRARDGGRLVFAVCSVLREECEAVAARLAAPAEDDLGVRLEPAPFDAEIARELSGGGDAFRLLPHVHGTDGYFAAMFVVRR
ncbi:RsmB/NOP family class I SAM-dependent RNA methyltransferase [Sorangium sp. So ce1389]|uniref:RsmB/NOP family class I SAM-dependent RNA methyltransferase n=1 Tax=Sorangium sp. So ce1389 TaxID=3133336 RepID=UPI003F5DD316